jgi:hypothetical protein
MRLLRESETTSSSTPPGCTGTRKCSAQLAGRSSALSAAAARSATPARKPPKSENGPAQASGRSAR